MEIKDPLLPVELVPDSLWSSESEYIPMDLWIILKQECFSRALGQCEICQVSQTSETLVMHQVFSINDEKSIISFDRFESLCQPCHDVKHIGWARKEGRDAEAKVRLGIVNQWNEQQVAGYLKKSWTEWGTRSRKTFTLELPGLKRSMCYEAWLKRNPDAELRFGPVCTKRSPKFNSHPKNLTRMIGKKIAKNADVAHNKSNGKNKKNTPKSNSKQFKSTNPSYIKSQIPQHGVGAQASGFSKSLKLVAIDEHRSNEIKRKRGSLKETKNSLSALSLGSPSEKDRGRADRERNWRFPRTSPQSKYNKNRSGPGSSPGFRSRPGPKSIPGLRPRPRSRKKSGKLSPNSGSLSKSAPKSFVLISRSKIVNSEHIRNQNRRMPPSGRAKTRSSPPPGLNLTSRQRLLNKSRAKRIGKPHRSKLNVLDDRKRSQLSPYSTPFSPSQSQFPTSCSAPLPIPPPFSLAEDSPYSYTPSPAEHVLGNPHMLYNPQEETQINPTPPLYSPFSNPNELSHLPPEEYPQYGTSPMQNFDPYYPEEMPFDFEEPHYSQPHEEYMPQNPGMYMPDEEIPCDSSESFQPV